MKFDSYLNEAKRIELTTDYSGPGNTTGFQKGDKLNVLFFDKDKNAVVWAKALNGNRKVAIPKHMYKKI